MLLLLQICRGSKLRLVGQVLTTSVYLLHPTAASSSVPDVSSSLCKRDDSLDSLDVQSKRKHTPFDKFSEFPVSIRRHPHPPVVVGCSEAGDGGGDRRRLTTMTTRRTLLATLYPREPRLKNQKYRDTHTHCQCHVDPNHII